MNWIARCTAALTFAAVLGMGSASLGTLAAAEQTDTVVHIADFAYKPPTVTIHTGQSVLFINDDDEAHTVTSSDKAFDSGGLDTHERWRHTFTKAGTYKYFCALHPYMKAVVIVTDGSAK